MQNPKPLPQEVTAKGMMSVQAFSASQRKKRKTHIVLKMCKLKQQLVKHLDNNLLVFNSSVISVIISSWMSSFAIVSISGTLPKLPL
jgi:hypothetical protein